MTYHIGETYKNLLLKMTKIKYMNLYAGLGGNIELLDDSDIEITNIELDQRIASVLQERKPNQKVIITDAHQYLLDYFKEFDFI